MKALATAAVFLAACLGWAQDPAGTKPVFLMDGLSNLHHPVSSRNVEAQKYFDQGLRLVYAFNHDEAARAFQKAADLDPQLGMAWWGLALAVGPNYNLPVDPDREKLAADAVDKARALSVDAPQAEKDYIEAMAKRFSHDAKADYHQLDVDYSNAMRALRRKYPDDLDAATLFADSMMNLRPWRLWNADGTPAPGTDEIVATLEDVLRHDPHHIGAMHLYIHAVEASPHPERALAQADQIAQLAPAAGHLVHMPSHIYERTGNFSGAREQNAAAAKADEAYAAATGAQGMYMMMYYSHNLHFGAVAASMQGHCAAARESANRLATVLQPALHEMPMVAPFLGMPVEMAVRCGRWDDLLKIKEPAEPISVLKAFWLYGRGMALAAHGKVDEAEALEKQLAALERAEPRETIFMPPVENHSWQIYQLADTILAARIAAARGTTENAITLLRQAAAEQDKLLYNEPADWYYPVRESLGGMLLRAGDAKAAEQVFREDLEQNPRNPRSLFGLAEALNRQQRDYEAAWVRQAFETAWQGADVELRIDDL
jgi:tetratricopeptide (TPR) repeat protein